jgi:threonine/homoserine/homoserine lactone efflux protein
MLGIHDFALFVLAGLLLNVIPGADMLYIAGRAGAQGFRAGVLAALGIGAGCFVHIVAATLGLSAILAASAMAFTVVKIIGAVYLIYVGLSLLRSTARPQQAVALARATSSKIFWQGFLTNALNPKVALFFLAFLPQFIALDAPSKSLAMLILGLVFDVNGTLCNVLFAWLIANAAERLSHRPAIGAWLNRSVGALFVYFGAKLAIEQGS